MKRRTLLSAAPALWWPAADGARMQTQSESLRDAARHAGLRIGSSSEVDLARDPAYAALLTANTDLFAPNMSWQRMSPTPELTTVELDPNIAFARRNGLALTGYHLLWHQRLPAWFDALDRVAAERAVVDHIGMIATRFGADTWSWNVVNEAIRPGDGLPGGLRRGPLMEKFGTGFFDIAFHAAQQFRPDVLRVYNDYDLELETPDGRARRGALLRLLDGFAVRSVPIGAVGLQCHLRTRSFDRFDSSEFRRFLSELASRGLAILITELDVLDQGNGDPASQDAEVADVYRRFLDIALAEPELRALVFWGLSDRYTWLNEGSRPNFARADGQPSRPSLFDTELRPKPALHAVETALKRAPLRQRRKAM